MSTNWIWAIVSGTFLTGLFVVPASRADDPLPVTKKDFETSLNNLKEIGIAFHAFQDVNDYLPIDISSKDGKPLLSWRVAILPYIEQAELYEKFKLDEPWDSPDNKKLIGKLPKTYAPVRVKAKEGETFYQVFSGKDALFGPKKKPKLTDVKDGTSVTGMVFEGGEPVIWTKPVDMKFDKSKPLPKLGGMFEGVCQLAMCDGSVRRLRKVPDEGELKKLIMPDDGGEVDFDKLDAGTSSR